MRLKGGVIIIGSLLWDNRDRCIWRANCLDELATKSPIPLKIRYGRESRSRCCTHTMIFSNDSSTELGQGYVVGFRRRIWGEKTLTKEAIALARAEGIWTKQRRVIACDWGAVGLLVNDGRPCAAKIRSLWKTSFQKQRSKRYCYSQYCFNDEQPIITDEGFLQFDPRPEMNEFDFLLATPTVPIPDRPLKAKKVADRMVEQNYGVYFNENVANGITTFQDGAISRVLNGSR